MSDFEDSDGDSMLKSQENATDHVKQLQRLQEKDPEFYQYLKEHDKELLEFNDKDNQDDLESDSEDDVDSTRQNLQTPTGSVITTSKVDSWCTSIEQKGSLSAIRSLLRAFKTACHHGDDTEDCSTQKFTILSSSVFNKIMVFVLNEMDGILRKLLEAPNTGGKKETILDLMNTKAWKSHGSLMRLYLGNALHILNEMTDEQMISFTLKRLKASSVFLAAFPVLLRKYIRVVLHTWGTGTGALPVVSFLFLRDLCVRLGSDCLSSCLKGVYKAYIMNCKLPKHISRSKLQHINFLGNCVSELYGLDPKNAYQHAFLSIRQLAVILRSTMNEKGSQVAKGKTKGTNQQRSSKTSKKQVEKMYQKVYDWQFLFCLELWTKVICAFSSEADFGPLAYPLAQIISGVATLVPTARYFPLHMRCIRMINCIADATDTFIPVSALLLDMLDMKALNSSPTGGVGKAVDMQCVKKLDKQMLKTRAFQEACIYSVVQELAEHFAHWSHSIAFFELSFITLVRLRNFCKSTKVDRFRREIRELIRHLESNCDFTNSRRLVTSFSPSDSAAAIFHKAEKESKNSPFLQFVANLRLRAQQRAGSIVESSVIVGEKASVFGLKFSETDEEVDEGEHEAAAVFGSSWMPVKKPKITKNKSKLLKKDDDNQQEPDTALTEDVVEDLVLSSDDDEDGFADDDFNGHEESNDGKKTYEGNINNDKKRKGRDYPANSKEKRTAGSNSKRKGSRYSKKNVRK